MLSQSAKLASRRTNPPDCTTPGMRWKYPLSPPGASPIRFICSAMNFAARSLPLLQTARPSIESSAITLSSARTDAGVAESRIVGIWTGGGGPGRPRCAKVAAGRSSSPQRTEALFTIGEVGGLQVAAKNQERHAIAEVVGNPPFLFEFVGPQERGRHHERRLVGDFSDEKTAAAVAHGAHDRFE